MKKSLIILLTLLVSANLQAQQPYRTLFADQAGSDSGTAEIRGCLKRSGGHYILIDKNNTYERLSNNGKLKNLVGHEVRLLGKPATRTIDTTLPGAASSAKEEPYFEVKTVEDVSPNCEGYPK